MREGVPPMREFAAGFWFGLTRPWRVLHLRSMTPVQLMALGVQGLALATLSLTYLAAAASPAPQPSPEPSVVPAAPWVATEAEDREWQRRQLELLIDEARTASK